MIETVIGIGVSLVQSLYEKYQDSNEEKRKAIIDTLKKMDKAAVATRMYINDNANYRDFRGYNMRTRLHLFELWNEAAYTALVIDFNTGMLLRQKSYYWSDLITMNKMKKLCLYQDLMIYLEKLTISWL
jgi:hypothetical protein